jgi:hypothetical protein
MTNAESKTTVSLLPVREDPVIIEGTINIPDGGNALNPYGVLGVPPRSPQAQQALLAASLEPTNDGGGIPGLHFLADTWNSTRGKLILLGSIAALAAVVIAVATLSSKRKDSSSKSTMTPAQAVAARTQLNQQITTESQALKSAGYSDSTIRISQNEVALQYGTQIAAATIVSPPPKEYGVLYVTKATSPENYASLESINSQAYITSLSRSPSANDILRNSAAVHATNVEAIKQ